MNYESVPKNNDTLEHFRGGNLGGGRSGGRDQEAVYQDIN